MHSLIAGGVSIRRNVAQKKCYDSLAKYGYATIHQREGCLNWSFKKYQSLARQTRTAIHIWQQFPDAVGNVTSFLVTLRNPIDRVISSYRYAHPGNCRPEDGASNYWCHMKKHHKLEPGNEIYELFVQCFPNAGIEDIAQATLPPYDDTIPNPHFSNQTLTRLEQCNCRQLARNTLRGGNSDYWAVLHLQYNYKYYADISYYKYPEKEVFAIRTEHQYEDMVALDKLLGGNGTFPKSNYHDSHGSEKYAPSPISETAYKKLCCVLEDEIAIYLDTFQKALNLNLAQYEEAESLLKQKCGLSPGQTWSNWRAQCRAQLTQPLKC